MRKFTIINSFLFWIFFININIYSQSTQCDNCPPPEVVLYGVQMNVPQPPPDDSLGEYTTPASQKALLNWIALGDAMVPMAQISSTDPEKGCVQFMDGTMAQELAANPDTNVIIHQQNFSTGDIPPSGSVAGVDYLIWSSIDYSGGTYHFNVYLEDAYSRTRIASAEADFSDPNKSQTAAQSAISQIEPVFDKIRTYQKNIRNLGGNDVAIDARISIIPSKGDMKGDETIPVVFQVKDCDGAPLSSRWVKINATNGHFDKDSIQTDGKGQATANFTADNVKDIANITGYYVPYFTVTHKTNGADGDTTVNIDYVPVRNWVEKISENYVITSNYSDHSIGSASYGSQIIHSNAEVTKYVVGDFQDSSITVDEVIGAKGSSTLWGTKKIIDNTYDSFENDTYTAHATASPSEDFMYGIGLDDFQQYGKYNGIGFMSGLMLYETQGWNLYEAGPAVKPSPYSIDTTIIFEENPDVYQVFTVGPNDIDGGNNASWTKTGSGFIFQGDFVYDTTITNPDNSSYMGKIHEVQHVVVHVMPYKSLTAVKSPLKSVLPSEYGLYQNFPNPFNPLTTIRYQIPKLSHVKLTVYDILGNLVAELVNEEKSPGEYSVSFNASSLASGVYFYRIEAGNFVQSKKLMILK